MHGGIGWLLADGMTALVYTRIEGGNKEGRRAMALFESRGGGL
jgi:hypothetical protein